MNLQYPLKGVGTAPGIYITQHFGENLRDYTQFGLKGHNGVDISAPKGTPILAAHDGHVTYWVDRDANGKIQGYGNYAVIQWNEDGVTWSTLYGHQDHFEGTERDVKAGEVIGYVNSTGYSTGDHLHFGLRKLINGVVLDYNNGFLGFIDPLPYLENKMAQIKLVNIHGEEGILLAAANPDELKALCAVFGKDPNHVEVTV